MKSFQASKTGVPVTTTVDRPHQVNFPTDDHHRIPTALDHQMDTMDLQAGWASQEGLVLPAQNGGLHRNNNMDGGLKKIAYLAGSLLKSQEWMTQKACILRQDEDRPMTLRVNTRGSS
jgi:hypothetical protein